VTDEQIVALAEQTKAALLKHSDRLEERLLERIEKTETTLLKEFRKYAVRIAAKSRVTDASLTGFSERLEVIEERLDDLDSHMN
jgi:hypothetical protein